MEKKLLIYMVLLITFETILLIKFIDNSLDKKGNIITVICLALVLIFFQAIQRIFWGSIGAVSIIPTFMLDLFIIIVGFHGKFSKKIFLLCTFYAFSIIFDAIGSLISSFGYFLITHTHINMDVLVMPSTLLSKALLLSIIVLLKESLKMNNNLSNWLKYLPAPLFTVIAIMWGSPFTKDVNNVDIAGLLIVVCTFSLLSNIYVIIAIHRSHEQTQLKYRLKIQKESKEISKIHYMELLEAYRQIERTAHDIKHHLNYLEAAENVEAVSEYIQKLNKRGFSKVERLTGNFDIDVILNAKKYEAKEKGINLEVNQILLPEIDWLDTIDIITIIGNCITNAIEACELCNGDKIGVFLRYSDNYLLITVENPTYQKIKTKDNGIGLISTKSGHHHGIGMESIAVAVETYDGFMKYEVMDGIFRLDILLQKGI